MKSPNYNHFAVAPQAFIGRSVFDRSKTYKSTFNSGYLIPCYLDEVLPGDTFNVSLTAFARLATPVVPFMDNLYMDFQFFFVPNRLVWSHWEELNGARTNPVSDYDSDTVYTTPTLTSTFANSSLGDYFGLPTISANLTVNALPFRCYNLIWNEWYRDQNLQNSVTVNTGDTDNIANYSLLKRGKRHDYFTSCLPWPQKGPGVEVSLGGEAPVIGNGHGLLMTDGTTPFYLGTPSASAAALQTLKGNVVKNVGATQSSQSLVGGKVTGLSSSTTVDSGLVAKLDGVSAATINSLREAFQIQKLFERDARGGTRYTEILRSHFGVVSPDARLQRPEYLGGGSIPIQIHSVAQTSATGIGDDATPQGNLAAYALCGGRVGFVKSFVEHGFVVGLVSVRADLTYQQGLNRLWSRKGRFDYYWPSLAHLGEQPVYNKEIYAQGDSVVDSAGLVIDDKVFGYQERFAEYRYGVSQITGQLRSVYSNSLDCWHLAQEFSSLPTLNSTFIQETPPLERVLAVTGGNYPQIIYDSLITCKCVRPMPTYSIPGMVDHF